MTNQEEQVTSGNNLKLTKLASFCYLGFPIALFFAAWLRLPYSLIVVSLIVYLLFTYYKQLNISSLQNNKISRSAMLILLYSIMFATLSGAGGLVRQKPDWTKHNVILNDLVNYSWPVYYGKSYFVEDSTLVYYIAYYLPAALVGKFLGWEFAQFALLLYTALGLFIFGLLLKHILGNKIRSLFPLFFLLSGLDLVGTYYMGTWSARILHMESYVSGLQFSSMMTILTWVPQHGIAAWIPLALFYVERKKSVTIFGPILIAFTFLWSPFVSLGLVLTWLQCANFRDFLNRRFILNATISFFFVIIMFLYYKSQLPLGDSKIKLYLLNFTSHFQAIKYQILFLLLDLFFTIPFFIIIRKRIEKSDLYLLWISYPVLIVVSQFMYGQNNDFVMRASIVHLSLIFILVLKYLSRIAYSKLTLTILILYIFAVGTVTSIVELAQLFRHSHVSTNERPIHNMMESHKRYGVSNQQYIGSASRLFGKLIGNYEKYIK